jgi:hypothetical protein
MKQSAIKNGEPLWLSGKVVKNEKINEIERTRVHSPPRATSLKIIINQQLKINNAKEFNKNSSRFLIAPFLCSIVLKSNF